MSQTRPAVGLLYNPAVPALIDAAPNLVEAIAVMPDRLWYDFGPDTASHRRFHHAHGAIKELRRYAAGRILSGHGIGLSLPSDMPLDEALANETAALAADFGFGWFSEHLSVFLTPHGSVPNAQAGLGLPVVYDDESFAIITAKLAQLRQKFACPLLLENGSIFTQIPDMDATEPEFLNRLYRQAGCFTLLDLHNLYVTARNGGEDPDAYLDAIDPACVMEIHLGGGDELAGFYTDSHSRLTPDEVWRFAWRHAPRFPNLRAITFEFHESYFERLGTAGLIGELERMHDLADACARTIKMPPRPVPVTADAG